MPQMLTLSNGRPETILSPKDFEDLIDKHMGMDCANYYQNLNIKTHLSLTKSDRTAFRTHSRP